MPDNAPVESDDKPDLNLGDFLEKRFEIISDSLISRMGWEERLAKWESQRYGDDRNDQNNDPWPNASNIRYTLADMVIEQKKAAYSQVIYSSEELAIFKALTPRNQPWSNNIARYFSQIIKEHTDFEEEIVFGLDSGLQDGESWMKISYDMYLEAPIFKWCENLMIITPGESNKPKHFPWMTEVIHLSEGEAFKKFGKLPNFKELWEMASTGVSNHEKSDTLGRVQNRYLRRGINTSLGSKRLVLWNHHYEDKDSNKRIVTICPDNPKFDLGGEGTIPNDREYPFVDPDKKSSWMFEQFRREWTGPNQHSSRGIPEIVAEYEFLLTALWRFKHNIMTMTQNPTFTTPNGLPPGSTNNFTLMSGSFLPSGAAPVQWPSPPIDFDREMEKTREISERRTGSFDSGLSGDVGQETRTAREISLVSSQKQLAVNYETTPWKKFIRGCYRQAWSRIVQFKPKSLGFFLKGTMQTLPPESINGDYMIDLSWSGDSLNKEFIGQKAQALHSAAMQLGDREVIAQTWKNLVQNFAPGESQRYEINPQIEQQDMLERIANEIDTMVSIGFPVRVKDDIDHYQAVLATMQYLQAQQHKQVQVDPQAMNLLSQYMAGHRQALQQSNPEQFKQLNQQLTELDQATQQQQQPQQMSSAPQGQMPQQVPQQQQQPQQGPNQKVSASINFKDLPPAGQIQMAALAGIRLMPQDTMQNVIPQPPAL